MAKQAEKLVAGAAMETRLGMMVGAVPGELTVARETVTGWEGWLAVGEAGCMVATVVAGLVERAEQMDLDGSVGATVAVVESVVMAVGRVVLPVVARAAAVSVVGEGVAAVEEVEEVGAGLEGLAAEGVAAMAAVAEVVGCAAGTDIQERGVGLRAVAVRAAEWRAEENSAG